MNRAELENYIAENYQADSDFPWAKYPNYRVFRHRSNRKWFALVMEIPKARLGLHGKETLHVVNFKCDPIMVGSLRSEPGFFPAYHMSKENWITAALDGSIPDDKLKMLLGMSFELTAPHIKKRGAQV